MLDGHAVLGQRFDEARVPAAGERGVDPVADPFAPEIPRHPPEALVLRIDDDDVVGSRRPPRAIHDRHDRRQGLNVLRLYDPPTMDPGFDVVCFAGKEWRSHRQRTHWIVTELADRGSHVLFVENLGTRLPHLRETRRAVAKVSRWALTSASPTEREVAPRIDVDSPLVPPFQHWRIMRRLLSAVLLRRLQRRLSWRDPDRPLVVVTYLPMPVIRDVARAIKADLLVYEWSDEASTHMIDARPAHRRRVARWEDEMRAAADLVFVASAELLRRRCADRPDAITLPHGAPRVDAAPSGGQRGGPSGHPTIGFVGSITEFTDLDLVLDLAQERPEWSFVMVGPARVSTAKLRDAGNVTFTGNVDYEAIDGYLASFDAAIIPYRITPAIEVSSPLKVHEYLAHGLPVVSVDIPEVRDLAPDVEVADGSVEFLDALDRALVRGRRTAQPMPTWPDRVDEMVTHIRAALPAPEEPSRVPSRSRCSTPPIAPVPPRSMSGISGCAPPTSRCSSSTSSRSTRTTRSRCARPSGHPRTVNPALPGTVTAVRNWNAAAAPRPVTSSWSSPTTSSRPRRGTAPCGRSSGRSTRRASRSR